MAARASQRSASQSHPPLSQELDARFSVFLNPIRDLTKNWEVDIAKYLEEYLEDLEGLELSLDGGITTMNFAEAAMLIQGSAAIYSKKVDFLWQMVQKTLELLSTRHALGSGGGADSVGGGGVGRKGRSDANIPFESLDNIQIGRNIDLEENDTQDCDSDNTRKSFKFLPSIPLNLIEKEVGKSQYRIPLLGRNNERIGSKEDFWLIRSYISPTGVLHLELPGEMLDVSSQCPMDVMEEDANNVPQTEIEIHPTAPEECANDPPPSEHSNTPPPASPPPSPPPPSPPPPSPPPPKDDQMNESSMDGNKRRYGLRKRNKDDEEILATLNLMDKLKPIDPNINCPPSRPPRAGRLRVPTPCHCHRPSEKGKKKSRSKKVAASKEILPVEKFITDQLDKSIKLRRDKMKMLPPEILKNVAEEEEKRINEVKKKLLRRLTDEGVGSEEALQTAEETVQEFIDMPHLEDDDGDDNPLDNDSPINLDLDNPGFMIPEPHTENQYEMEVAARPSLDDSMANEEPSSPYEALVAKWVADYVNSAQESMKSSDLEKRVNQWRKKIMPRLKEEEERKAFDIHKYGSSILNRFPKNGSKQTITFKQLLDGSDRREVARYFLSTLILANNNNIELSQTKPGQLANDSLELTLKSRVRHHEELEEYVAPSQTAADTR